MAGSAKVQIIGIGDDGADGLTQTARDLIVQADVIIGAEHTLARVTSTRAEKIVLGADLEPVLETIRTLGNRRGVVLVSGDPLFYGLARFLCERLGKDQFDVVPHVSSMQLAFARVKESWEEAYLTNLANHTLEHVVERIRTADKVGLFTTDSCPPKAISRALLDRRIDYFRGYVCENLGSRDERVTQGELADFVGLEFSPLNVMILVRRPGAPDRPNERIGRRLFGNPDEAFLQSRPKKGLLTPAEVRSLALAQMDLGPASIVWDVGAGSGSIAIEAAQIAADGTTYAIEMDPEDHALIADNAKRFGVSNLQAVLGRAPDAWDGLPAPDSVFCDGSGREISRLADLAYERLRPGGRLVATVGSIESLAELHGTMQRRVADVRVWMINVARGNHQLERMRFEALNPTFLLALLKPS